MAAKTWPRSYLLTIYDAAVNNGFIWINDVTEDEAKSLKMTLYRLRRRSDGSNVTFIIPEYHLVTCGEWAPYEPLGAIGKMPVVYSALPDGTAYPALTTRDGTLLGSDHKPHPAPVLRLVEDEGIHITALTTIDPAELKLDPENIKSYVDRLVERVKERDGDEPEDF